MTRKFVKRSIFKIYIYNVSNRLLSGDMCPTLMQGVNKRGNWGGGVDGEFSVLSAQYFCELEAL
jgi:hypothetical protein